MIGSVEMIQSQFYMEPPGKGSRTENTECHDDQTAYKNDALKAAMNAAEAAMQAMKLTDDNNKKRELMSKTHELLQKAELIKSARVLPLQMNYISGTKKNIETHRTKVEELKQPVPTRILSTREQIILLQGSKLNGSIFPPWKTPPDVSEFVLEDGSELFT